jgi:hypothetical protein
MAHLDDYVVVLIHGFSWAQAHRFGSCIWGFYTYLKLTMDENNGRVVWTY